MAAEKLTFDLHPGYVPTLPKRFAKKEGDYLLCIAYFDRETRDFLGSHTQHARPVNWQRYMRQANAAFDALRKT